MKVKVTQLCWILCDPLDCSLPDSSIQGILLVKYWSGLAVPFSRGSSKPRNWTQVSCTAGRFFTIWATGEAQWISKDNIIFFCLCFELWETVILHVIVYYLLSFPIQHYVSEMYEVKDNTVNEPQKQCPRFRDEDSEWGMELTEAWADLGLQALFLVQIFIEHKQSPFLSAENRKVNWAQKSLSLRALG